MSHKTANPHIGCTVKSCSYHCEEKDNCSLSGITIKECPGCGSGKAADESMCSNYVTK